MKSTVLILCAVLLFPIFSHATQVRPATLDMVVRDAADVFCGICEGVKVENTDLGKTYKYTFKVNDWMKRGPGNETGDTITFTQIGFKDMPVYLKGSEYCLFLAGTSKWGLRAPVAYHYGKYDIVRAEDGSRNIRGAVNPEHVRPSVEKGLNDTERESLKRLDKRGNVRNIDRDLFIKIVRGMVEEGRK